MTTLNTGPIILQSRLLLVLSSLVITHLYDSETRSSPALLIPDYHQNHCSRATPKAWKNAQGEFDDLIYCLFIFEAREAASLMSKIQVLLVTGRANLF